MNVSNPRNLPQLNVIEPPPQIDPVCGMSVVPRSSTPRANYDGREYLFCCESCRKKFETSPQSILDRAASAESCCHSKTDKSTPANVSSDTLMMCPMHPEVEQYGPGDCPICGMDLEPKEVQIDTSAEDAQLRDMWHRFVLAAYVTLPLFVLAMGPMVGLHWTPYWPSTTTGWLQAVLSAIVLFYAGLPLLTRGWRSIRTGNWNMFTLIAIGSLSAFGFSLAALAFPALIPQAFYEHGVAPIYFEAAAVIIALVLLGQVLELRARQKTGEAVRELMQLTPPIAHRIDQGNEIDVPIDQVQTDDRLRIRPGERVPVDGVVVEGKSWIDQSNITGEPIPVEVEPGETVIAGTLNQQGSIVVEARQVGSETMISQIVRLVSQAQRSRAPIQNQVDEVAKYFVPAVIVCAILAVIGWLLWGPEPRLPHALVSAIAVLIVACPCALGLATPMSIMVGVGRGAKEGVLIKNADVLQAIRDAKHLVVDKTGTLTEGRPKLVEIQVLAPGRNEEELLAMAAAVESASEHPLARAIVLAARDRELSLPAVDKFQSTTAQGVSALVGSKTIYVGSDSYIGRFATIDQRTMLVMASLQQDSQSVVLLSDESNVLALFGIKDPIKASTKEALRVLRSVGLEIHMMTGDSEETALAVAQQLGITNVHARLKPQDKYDLLKKLRAEGEPVIMAGDGVNDAPALALADVGIAMGQGSDMAIESAGVVLIGGDLMGVAKAVRLSRAMMNNIWQNLFFAFGYNAVGIPIAAGVLYPAFGILLSPMLAAAAMSLSSVSVIGNALRLRHISLREPSR